MRSWRNQSISFDEKLEKQSISFDAKLEKQSNSFDEKLNRFSTRIEDKLEKLTEIVTENAKIATENQFKIALHEALHEYILNRQLEHGIVITDQAIPADPADQATVDESTEVQG